MAVNSASYGGKNGGFTASYGGNYCQLWRMMEFY